MNAFFKPLRRKLGVVTLLLACVAAAGWVRSMRCVDLIYLRCPPLQNVVVSGEQGICFAFLNMFHRTDIVIEDPEDDRVHIVLIPNESAVPAERTAGWYRYPVSQVRLYQSENNQLRSLAVIPYWSVTTPLMFFSVWLLFGGMAFTTARPRQEGLRAAVKLYRGRMTQRIAKD